MGDPKGTYHLIGKAVVLIAILTTLDKLLAFIKEMLVAYRFGVSPALDAFNVAYALPATILLYFSGALGAAFVPVYLGWLHGSSPERADSRVRSILLCLSFFFGALTALGFAFSPVVFPLLGYGLPPAEQQLGISIERILIFLLLFEGANILLASLLHAQKKFFTLYLAPTLINATCIIFLVCGAKYGIFALVWGLLSGTALKFACITISLRRSGFSVVGRVTWDMQELKDFLLLVLPLLGSELIVNSNALIDMIMATQLPSGSVSTLRYAYRINDLPIQIIIIAISKAIFPFISEQAIEKDHEGMAEIFKRSITLIGFITLPIIALVSIFSRDIVSILFERGAFDSNATLQTAQTLVFYNIGLFFSAYAFINGAFFCALKKMRILLYLGCATFALNILFNYVFMNVIGIRGIALSTSVTLGIICTIYFCLLQRALEVRNLTATFYQLFKMAVAAGCMLVLGLIIKDYIRIPGFGRVLNTTCSALIGAVSYLLFTLVLGVQESRIGWQAIGKWTRRTPLRDGEGPRRGNA